MGSYLALGTGEYNFPSRDVEEDVKNGDKYNLDYCRAIYHRYRGNKCGVRFHDTDNFEIARAYGRGDQPVSIYKNPEDEPGITDNTTDITGGLKSKKGWENIMWDIVSPMPRIKTIVKGYLDQFGQDVFVDAIDARSGAVKEAMKWKMFTIAQSYDFLNEYHAKAGIPMEELDFFPANTTELNIFEAMGGFKLNFARTMQKLIRHTEDISLFDDDLKDRWADDLMDIGVVASKVVFDNETGKFKYRYVDPAKIVIQYVRNGEYERSEYAGEIEPYTISELRQLMPDKGEDYFKNMAGSYNGKSGNRQVSDWDNFSKRQDNNSYNYDSFTVDVMDVEWIDYVCRRHLIYDSKRGRKSVIPLKLDSEVKPLSDGLAAKGASQQDLKTKMRKLRKAKWVIGTECVFDAGPVEMTDRPNKSTVMHNYRLFVLKDSPIVEQLMPIADDMELAWLKYQSGRAIAVQTGYSVDVGMMNNIDGGKITFAEVLKLWRKTAVMLHQQSLTGDYHGGSTSPVQVIPSIMGDIINEWIMTWDSALKRIEDLTGLNLIVLGNTVNPNAPVGTTQMSANSAIHVLKPIIDTIARMKTTMAETTMRRLQLACKARKNIIDNYEPVVGEADLQLLVIAEKDAVQYGLMFNDRPSQEAKQNIINGAQVSLNNRRDGKPGINLSQYMYIASEVESGADLKEMRAMIDYMEAKSVKEEQAKQEANIKQQNDALAQIQKDKIDGEKFTNKLKSDTELTAIKTQGEIDFQLKMMELYPELFRQQASMMVNGGGQPAQPVAQPVQESVVQEQPAQMPMQ
jgi:hypothetical protein